MLGGHEPSQRFPKMQELATNLQRVHPAHPSEETQVMPTEWVRWWAWGESELPTNGLGIGRLFLNVYVFSAFSLVDFVLFWA